MDQIFSFIKSDLKKGKIKQPIDMLKEFQSYNHSNLRQMKINHLFLKGIVKYLSRCNNKYDNLSNKSIVSIEYCYAQLNRWFSKLLTNILIEYGD